MKIKELKINAFGNLKDKEISLSNHINIIQGKNESGKSTLLKYIISMFYGISKNKRGKEYTDYEKYMPWENTEFSGKIGYELDNGETYEIFRDFRKKNPKIYNANLEEISKDFSVNKTTGNEFFFEQTNIEESMFLSTLVTQQEEVRLDRQTQNFLIQKVANLAGTGEDNISYKKAIDKLNKKQVEEIGSSRSQGRPLNVVQEELKNTQIEKERLICYKDKQYEMEKIQQKLEEEIKKQELYLEIIKEIKKINEKEKIEKEKINLNEKIKINNEEKKEELKKEKNKLEEKIKVDNYFFNYDLENKNKIENDSEEENKKLKNKFIKIKKEKNKIKKHKKTSNFILISILLIWILISIFNIMYTKNRILSFVCICIMPLDLLAILVTNIVFYKRYQNENEKEKQIEKQEEIENIGLKNILEKIKSQIELIEKNIEEEKIEIQKLNNKINLEMNLEKEKIKNKYQNKINAEIINNYIAKENIEGEKEKTEKELQKNQLELHALFLDKNNILPKLEKLAYLEEKIESLKKQEEDLLKDNSCIELVRQTLEIAYQKMKEKVTPKFTQNLSRTIAKISNEKYQKVSVNDEEGMMIEKENGEYIPANQLSVGTIDQLYISLRLSMIKELSKEKLPIMLDESFAYYDEQRLQNMIEYLHKEFLDYQILIFTCTNREKQILEKQEIPYHLVQL